MKLFAIAFVLCLSSAFASNGYRGHKIPGGVAQGEGYRGHKFPGGVAQGEGYRGHRPTNSSTNTSKKPSK